MSLGIRLRDSLDANLRGRKYTDPVEFARKIQEYFDYCDCLTEGHPERTIYSTCEMASYLGIPRKEQFFAYRDKEEFKDIVDSAMTRIEAGCEIESRTSKNPAGAIFSLKNYGWRDENSIKFAQVPAAPLTFEVKIVSEASNVDDVPKHSKGKNTTPLPYCAADMGEERGKLPLHDPKVTGSDLHKPRRGE